MAPVRTHHILDTAATLLGVALLIVTAVHITGNASGSIADELSFASALLFIASCFASHRGIAKSNDRYESVADKLFALALLILLCSVLSFWF